MYMLCINVYSFSVFKLLSIFLIVHDTHDLLQVKNK